MEAALKLEPVIRDTLRHLAQGGMKAECDRAFAGLDLSAPTPAPSVLLGWPAFCLLEDLSQENPAYYPQLAAAIEALGRVAKAAHPGKPVALRDLQNQTRPVYYPLAAHQILWAVSEFGHRLPKERQVAVYAGMIEILAPLRKVEQYRTQPPPVNQRALALWQALVLCEAAIELPNLALPAEEEMEAVVHQILSQPHEEGGLLPMDEDASLDGWTFDELVGMHALSWLAMLTGREAWKHRLVQAARYHLENSQPDNTTNHPWALFAFAQIHETLTWPVQQLHDVRAHRETSALPLMLLCDALLAIRWGGVATEGL